VFVLRAPSSSGVPVLLLNQPSDCYEITSQAANIVEELNSTQEEADTRLILHAAHVAKSGYKAVVMTVRFFFF